MQLKEILNQIPGVGKDFVYYLEDKGYIHPRKIQKDRISRREYSRRNYEIIASVFKYYKRGYPPKIAYQLVTKEERMVAYVLMEVPGKQSRKVLESLKEIDGVKEAAATYGDSDIIAKIDVPDISELDEIIVEKIEILAGVKSTHTLIVLHNSHWKR
jgi:DNA-binding Lrp family transcriptional regulator